MKLVKVTMVLAMIFALVPAASGFTENWDSGSINASLWTVTDTDGTDIILEDLGGGDYALALKGTQDGGNPHWGDHIYSVAGYNRADNVVLEFRVWIKPSINVQLGIHGGGHNSTAGPQYSTPEATYGYVVSDIRCQEAGDGLQGGPSTASFTTDLTLTNDKSNALIARLTLGATQGAKWEYSKDGGSNWILERDTLGSGTSSTATNYIGFGPFDAQAGTTLIDDITVIPEPATLALLALGSLALLRRRRR